jgi:predicted PurR-regulated permease PerM
MSDFSEMDYSADSTEFISQSEQMTTPTSEANGVEPARKPLISALTRFNLILLCLGFLLFLFIKLAVNLSAIVAMLAGAMLLSYLLLAPVRVVDSLLYRTKLPLLAKGNGLRRLLAIIATFLLFFGTCGIIVIRIAPPLALQLKEFAQDTPIYVNEVDLFLTDVETLMAQNNPTAFKRHLKAVRRPQLVKTLKTVANPMAPLNSLKKMTAPEHLLSQTARLSVEKLREVSRETVHMLLNLGTLALSGLVYSLTALVFAFYLLKDGRNLRKGLVSFMPTREEGHAARFLHRVHLHLYNLVKAQALMSILSGGLLYFLLMLFSVKYALLMSVGFGLVSILPVIGPWLGLLPILLMLSLAEHMGCVISVILLMGFFHTLKAAWLWPMVLHARYRVIHPVLFILTLLVCIHLLGVVGVLLVFPMTGFLAVTAEWLKHRQQQRQALLGAMELHG